MKWLARIIIAGVLSTGVAVSLSYLFQLDDARSVFRTVKAEAVSDANIVDVMLESELQLRIQRVELTGSIVSVDLSATASTEPDTMLHDMYQLPQHLFSASTNIDHIFIRVMENSGTAGKSGGSKLLIASEVSRGGWMVEEAAFQQNDAAELKRYLESHSRLTYTSLWKKRFETSGL